MAGRGFFRSTELFAVVYSPAPRNSFCIRERNNPEELGTHLLRGGSVK